MRVYEITVVFQICFWATHHKVMWQYSVTTLTTGVWLPAVSCAWQIFCTGQLRCALLSTRNKVSVDDESVFRLISMLILILYLNLSIFKWHCWWDLLHTAGLCFDFNIVWKMDTLSWNKRAQRDLGHSPEEKVKGHSGANNKEPHIVWTTLVEDL